MGTIRERCGNPDCPVVFSLIENSPRLALLLCKAMTADAEPANFPSCLAALMKKDLSKKAPVLLEQPKFPDRV